MNNLIVMPLSVDELKQLITDCIVSATPRVIASDNSDEELLTPEQAANFLKVSRVSIFTAIKKEQLHPIRLGKSVRLKKSDLLQLSNLKQTKRG